MQCELQPSIHSRQTSKAGDESNTLWITVVVVFLVPYEQAHQIATGESPVGTSTRGLTNPGMFSTPRLFGIRTHIPDPRASASCEGVSPPCAWRGRTALLPYRLTLWGSALGAFIPIRLVMKRIFHNGIGRCTLCQKLSGPATDVLGLSSVRAFRLISSTTGWVPGSRLGIYTRRSLAAG